MNRVTPNELAYQTLKKHSLIHQAPTIDATRVIEDICGLNAQGALNYNLSLWARVKNLNNQFIKEALHEKTLLRSWFMRNTVHILTAKQAFIARPALRESLMQEWNRWTIKTNSKQNPESWNIHYPKVLASLEEKPLSISELLSRYTPNSEHPRQILSRVVREMSLKGLIYNAEPRGPWYHDTEQTYISTKQWMPNVTETDKPLAQRILIMDYLRAYGPATVQDYAYWTGMKVSTARAELKKIESELSLVEVSGQKEKLYIPLDTLLELNNIEVIPLVRLLPKFDSLLMGHKDKSRFMDEATKKQVFLPMANVSATVLVDGRVEGVWNIKKDGDMWKLNFEFFKKLDEEHMNLLYYEVQSMKEFTGFEIYQDQGFEYSIRT